MNSNPIIRRLAALASLSLLLGGCATHSPTARFIGDAATVTSAGAAGYSLSNKQPAVAAGAAVAALGVKRFMDSKADRERVDELDQAYKRGMAQQAKLADAAIQNVQKTGGTPENDATTTDETTTVTKLPLTIPERTINGVKVNATQEVVTIPNN